jgi:hypothetical protein
MSHESGAAAILDAIVLRSLILCEARDLRFLRTFRAP